MTENRCIEVLKKMKHMFTETCAKIDENTALDMAVESIKDIQQYRAIESELRDKYNANVDIKMLMQHFIETIFKGEKHEGFCILTNEDAKMWDEYRAIGTVEDFKALAEKQTAVSREIRHGDYFCPKCGAHVEYRGYCHGCGQRVY